MIHGTKPNLTGLPEWGSKVFVHKQDHGKLDSKTEEGYWVSYSEDSLGHHVYWANKRHVTTECNITFDGKEVLVSGNMQNEEGSNSPSCLHITLAPNEAAKQMDPP